MSVAKSNLGVARLYAVSDWLRNVSECSWTASASALSWSLLRLPVPEPQYKLHRDI